MLSSTHYITVCPKNTKLRMSFSGKHTRTHTHTNHRAQLPGDPGGETENRGVYEFNKGPVTKLIEKSRSPEKSLIWG